MKNSEKTAEVTKAQVPSQIDTLGDTLDDLESTIDLLRSRLQPVLRDEKGDAVDPKDEEVLVDVANIIRKYHRRVRGATEAICTITNLLEL